MAGASSWEGWVADFGQRLPGLRKIGGRDEQIEVGETAEGEVAVGGLRQHGSFVGKCAQLLLREMPHDPRQFRGEPQAATKIRGVGGSERLLDLRGKPAGMRGQVARCQCENAVMLGQAQKFVPVLVVRRSLFALRNSRMNGAFDT